MRTHGDFVLLDLWTYGDAERALVAAVAPAIARFECIEREGEARGWLDLVWEHDGVHTVVCGVHVDLVTAARNDERALIIPRCAQRLLDDDTTATLAALLVPELRLLMQRRVIPLETVLRFAPSPAFDRARTAGELGAAPLTEALSRVATWRSALACAGGGPVTIRGASGAALGVALAARLGVRVTDAAPEASAWYTLEPLRSGDPAGASIADRIDAHDPSALRIVFDAPPSEQPARRIDVVAVLPIDRVFSNDPRDGPVARSIWVLGEADAAPVQVERTALGIENRAGLRIAFVMRPDFAETPDADTDEAEEFALRLRAAGFPAELTAHEVPDMTAGPTLPIVVGALGDPHVYRTAAHFTTARHPFAVMLLPDAPPSDWYDEAIATIARTAHDDDELQSHLHAFEQRSAAEWEAARADAAVATATDDALLGANLVGAALVRVAATDRLDDIGARVHRPDLPMRAFGPVVVPSVAEPAEPFGARTFVLVHAPAVAQSGLEATVLALRDTEIPLVVATSAADPGRLATLQRIAGLHTRFVIDAAVAELDELYAHATLFIDGSLRPRGLARVVRAARAGAIPVVFAASPLAQVVPRAAHIMRVSPIDLRDTVRRLWDGPERFALRAIVQRTIGIPLGSEAGVANAAHAVLRTIFERVIPNG